MSEWHCDVLGLRQQRVLRELGPLLCGQGAYLAGGTAIALHMGHRVSVDLDFFQNSTFGDPHELVEQIKQSGIPFQSQQLTDKAIHGTARQVKVTLMWYAYLRIRRVRRCPELNCDVAALDDLAAMKLAAVCQRSSKKDFVDVWALLKSGRSLRSMLTAYQRTFDVADVAHVLYRLADFDEVDRQAMPRMRWKSSWKQMKDDLSRALKSLRT